jgi:hypothetical protein
MLIKLVLSRQIHGTCLLIVFAVASILGTVTAQSQSISADFGNRTGSTPVVPSGLFSVGGVGSTLSDMGTISRLTAAGLNGTRLWVSLQQIYATQTPNFNTLDGQLEIAKSARLHPIAVIYKTPSSLGSTACAPPSNAWEWGQMAKWVVAHVNQKFPGLVLDYEIWNEPELATSLCISDAATRLNTYLTMFYEAASAMHAQAQADGQPIRTGGPTISQMSQAKTWIPALLTTSNAARYVDFVSFHVYITGQSNIDLGMTWSDLYSITQSSTHGLAYYYNMVEALVRAGHQPNPASTPIYITEYNDNWAYSNDCCRNNATYGSLWNTLAVTDFLNVVYNGAKAVPSRLGYFNSNGNYFCIMGKWDADMDCNPSVLEPYPQFYAYTLFASPDYLNLQAGGHMAASVSPSSTTSGLSATAFYTNTADNVAVINPTSTTYSAVTIDLTNPGLTSPIGKVYLIDASHGQISSQSVNMKSISGGYSAVVEVPPYSTVALSMRNGLAGAAATAVLSVTPQSGTHPLAVNIDSSASQSSGSAIVARTIDFGDGTWLNWTPSTSHTYSKTGTYTIRLSLKDQAGQLSTISTSITVH